MRLPQTTIRGLMIGVMAASLLFAIVRLANQPDESVFHGTVTRIDIIGHTHNPLLRWVVTLKIDKMIRGSLPVATFQLAIHSPSQEGVELGHQYRISVRKSKAGYDYCGSHPWLPIPPDPPVPD
jgi:hypothetical protein